MRVHCFGEYGDSTLIGILINGGKVQLGGANIEMDLQLGGSEPVRLVKLLRSLVGLWGRLYIE